MGLIRPAQLLVYLIRGLVMLIAIPVHEAAHALASAKLGDTTAKDYGRLTLNPLAHFDLLGGLCMIFTGIGWARPVPAHPARFKNPKLGMALTAAAGPASNLLLAFVGMILYKVFYYFAPVGGGWDLVVMFLQYLVIININLAVFNLLPVPPFDGSRIATLFLPQRLYFKIMQYERYIFMAVFLLLMMGMLDLPLRVLNNLVWNVLVWATSFIEAMIRVTAGVAV